MSAGTLGLIFLQGFAFYVSASMVLSGVLYLTTGSKRDLYFPTPSAVVWEGVTKNMFTYVLFWTIAYGMIHVY